MQPILIEYPTVSPGIQKCFISHTSIDYHPKEIYTSRLGPFEVRGWRYHKRSSSFLSAVTGSFFVHVAAYKSSVQSFLLENNTSTSLLIPPGFWYCFASNVDSPSIILNASNFIYDEDDIKRANIDFISVPSP